MSIISIMLLIFTIIVLAAPSLTTITLTSSSATNTTDENLTITTDQDNNASVKLTYNWYKNGTSLTLLNMPFEADGTNNASDYSGNDNSVDIYGATWNNNSGYDSWGTYSFDGDDYINLSQGNFSFGTEPFTIEFWIYINSYTDTNVFGRYQNNDGIMLYIRQSSSPDGRLEVFHGSGTPEQTYFIIPSGEWHHIAVVGNGTKIRAALDGVFHDNTVTQWDIDFGDNRPWVGRYLTYYFNGYLDEYRIYKGVALSDEQIVTIAENKTNFIVSQETSIDDDWNATVTPNEGTQDGVTMWSDTMVILEEAAEEPDPAVPEFSDYAIALLLLTVVCGFFVIRAKREE